MLNKGQAGIDCGHCGTAEIVDNHDDMELLSKSLEWTDNGDPICPVCGNAVTFEDYLDVE